MYSYLKGEITEINATHITVETYGIGYSIKVPNPYSYSINTNITIYLHHHVREEIIELYGFQTQAEKDMFEKLISVKGLGPKGALAILSSATVFDIKNATKASNSLFFSKFAGIGPKLSQQIILDLKCKIIVDEPNLKQKDERLHQVSLALKSLGYSTSEIKNTIKQLKLDLNTSIEDAIKQALKCLNSQK